MYREISTPMVWLPHVLYHPFLWISIMWLLSNMSQSHTIKQVESHFKSWFQVLVKHGNPSEHEPPLRPVLSSTGSRAFQLDMGLFNTVMVLKPRQNQVSPWQGYFPYLGQGEEGPLLLRWWWGCQGVPEVVVAIFGAMVAPHSTLLSIQLSVFLFLGDRAVCGWLCVHVCTCLKIRISVRRNQMNIFVHVDPLINLLKQWRFIRKYGSTAYLWQIGQVKWEQISK